MTKKQKQREAKLLPGGVPRYVRCYDDGGNSIDRYTAVFCGVMPFNRKPRPHGQRGQWTSEGVFPYLAMNCAPFHPQGFCQHGETVLKACDVNGWGFAPAIGKRCHLGRRIPFNQLPEDCRKVVLRDYREIWGLQRKEKHD